MDLAWKLCYFQATQYINLQMVSESATGPQNQL